MTTRPTPARDKLHRRLTEALSARHGWGELQASHQANELIHALVAEVEQGTPQGIPGPDQVGARRGQDWSHTRDVIIASLTATDRPSMFNPAHAAQLVDRVECHAASEAERWTRDHERRRADIASGVSEERHQAEVAALRRRIAELEEAEVALTYLPARKPVEWPPGARVGPL